MNFYALIIGTEILNGRRVDKHFEFIRDELAKYGHELFASFVIKDDSELIAKCFKMIKADKDSVLFSFGGIGSTPDDLTREIASKIFREKPLQTHEQFKQDILKKFANEAYPHRIHMADLPPNSELIFNPINNMSGFSLDKRFFFVPGFPMMAHPMLSEIIKKYFGKKEIKFRKTLLAQTSENTLISIMQKIPSDIELSSLPIFKEGKPSVELSLSYKVESVLEKYFSFFTNELENLNIPYTSNK
jgi:molybdopterin-biosynthesis enzyme MoeA-like protein